MVLLKAGWAVLLCFVLSKAILSRPPREGCWWLMGSEAGKPGQLISSISTNAKPYLAPQGGTESFTGLCWDSCPHFLKPPAPLRARPASKPHRAELCPLAVRRKMLGWLLSNRQARGRLLRSLHLASAAIPNMDVISVLFSFRQNVGNGIRKQCSACPQPARNLLWTACSAQHVPTSTSGGRKHLGSSQGQTAVLFIHM